MSTQGQIESINIITGVALIYGGSGAIGVKCITTFKSNKFCTISVDHQENPEADHNIIVNLNDELAVQETKIVSILKELLQDNKLDAVVCVAGGWTGGNAEKDLSIKTELLWRHCVWPSLVSANIACKFLKEGGLLTLTGAKVALGATPTMVGYGLAKAAVHQLTKSLAGQYSGMPTNSVVIAILPVILDTPSNRESMPNADFSTWTSLQFVADLILTWAIGKRRAPTGSLLQLVTKNFNTEIIAV